MSDTPEPGPEDNPFAGLPMFGDIARMLQGQGPLNWDIARQVALGAASGGTSEGNVDPVVRIAFNELGRIAELHVAQETGLNLTSGGRSPEFLTVTPGVWAQRALDAYRPLMVDLATALGRQPGAPDEEPADPMMSMMAGLSRMMAPSMLGMAVGSMVGNLAARAFGQYDLPIPRPASHELLVIPATIDRFATDWSLAVDEVRLWVCLQELAAHALLGVGQVRDELARLVQQHVSAFQPDPGALAEKMSAVDLGDGDPMAAMQQILGNPELLLGAVESPAQRAGRPQLDALVALVVGFVDHVIDRCAPRLMGGSGAISEAIRRRRIESSPQDVFVERLLGLSLTRQQVERGRAFVAGVIERAGDDGLAQLWLRTGTLPTPAELDAPGLWLARIEL